MIEEWKPIENFKQYHISNTGKIKNSNTGKILKCTRNKSTGYLGVAISPGGRGNSTLLRVHKVLADHWLPNPQRKPFVNHIDGDKTNNSLKNLEWVTASENIQHAYDTNLIRAPKGEECSNSILTESLVLEIREKYKSGSCTQRQLAVEYNVGKTTIWSALNKQTWSHI